MYYATSVAATRGDLFTCNEKVDVDWCSVESQKQDNILDEWLRVRCVTLQAFCSNTSQQMP
jgi:hypothetical protein